MLIMTAMHQPPDVNYFNPSAKVKFPCREHLRCVPDRGNRLMPGALWQSQGGGQFLMSRVPLYAYRHELWGIQGYLADGKKMVHLWWLTDGAPRPNDPFPHIQRTNTLS